jgi:hypothetical protein
MTLHRFVIASLCAGLFWSNASVAWAQRGSLIEDLFRTVAEAQLQRQQQESQQQGRYQPSRRPRLDPIPPGVPSGNGDQAAFASALDSFTRQIQALATDMQSYAGRHPEIRTSLPGVFQISSQANALLRICDNPSSPELIAHQYAHLDARWRKLSFQLQSNPALTPDMLNRVRSCDGFVSTMSSQLGIAAQVDRLGLHQQMIVAATHMQCLLDDLEICDLSSRQRQPWTHDGRLLRQELLRTASEVERLDHEEIKTRFTDFSQRWRAYSDPIRQINNPFMNARLDRISQCGEETYAMLWMRPPVSSVDLAGAVDRLDSTLSELMGNLTLRLLGTLDRTRRRQVDDALNTMQNESKNLNDAIRRQGNGGEMREHFSRFDRAWLSIRDTLTRMDRLDRRLLDAIERECLMLRRALNVESSAVVPLRLDELIDIAAALEGSAEYFRADIDRYQRFLKPADYRRSISRAADDFYAAAKRLHADLFAKRDLRTLSREADDLVDAWGRLSGDLSKLRDHGLTGRRAVNLENASRELAPLVAQIGVALLD